MHITVANIVNRPLHRLDSPTGAKLPIGLLGIVSFLENNGFVVDFRDLQTLRRNPLKDITGIVDFLTTPSPVLSVSCLSPLLPQVIAAVKIIKEAHPEKRVILGGMGPSLVAAELLEAFPFVDGVVQGEGEIPLLRILRGEPFDWIAGLAYREADGTVRSSSPGVIPDLDSLPLPAYEHWDFERERNSANIVTARGCPFRCSFCSDPIFWEHRYRPYGITHVMKDLALLTEDYRQSYLTIEDDTFTAARSRAMEIAGRIVERGLKIEWATTARADCVDGELLQALRGAGCSSLMMGIESGSERLLQRIKPMTVARIIQSAGLIRACGMSLYCSFFWGLPDETLEDFYHTLRLIVLLKERFDINLIFYQYIPFPNLPDFPHYRDSLFLSEEALGLGGTLPYVEDPGVMALVKGYPRLFSTYYSAPTPGFSEKVRLLLKMSDHVN